MDLLAIAKQLKPVRGQRLASWLQRFLVAPADNLDEWQGRWTEVTTAKVVEIYRHRGLIEEAEADTIRFSQLVNACYRTQVFVPPSNQAAGSETTANPSRAGR